MSIVNDVVSYAESIMGEVNFQCDKRKKIGYRFYHSKLVANLCIYILENCMESDIPYEFKKEMQLKKDIICIAALLHDIKKDKNHHAEKAAEELRNIILEISVYCKNDDILKISEEDMLIIEDMIRNHGSHGSNNKFSKYYIKLIQDADNISKYVNFLPDEVFTNVFNISNGRYIYYRVKEDINEKHKKLNYLISRKMIKMN